MPTSCYPPMPRILRIAATLTLMLGCVATLGGMGIILSGMNILRTQDLGLGGVGLVIGLLLVGVVVVLPGLLYLALAWPMRWGRLWAIRLVMSIASLHLLLVCFCGFLILSDPRSPLFALLITATVGALLIGFLCCLLRCIPMCKALQSQPRGFQPIMAGRTSSV